MTTNLVEKLKTQRKKSNHTQHKISAVILYKNKPISFGFNDQTKTHPAIRKYSAVKTMHAEMAAIFKLKNKKLLKNCTMVVYRENRQGEMANSRPCEVCEEMLRDYGIKHIIYSSDQGWIEEKL